MLRLASDCTGAAAPEQAWASVSKILVLLGITDIALENVFGSEAADAKHCHKYLHSNLRITTLYIDLVERTSRMLDGSSSTAAVRIGTDGELQTYETALPKPGLLDNYSIGFECQDLSGRNSSGTLLDLSHDPSWFFATGFPERVQSMTRSQRTLVSSMLTIKRLQARTILIENVGSCPTDALLAYFRTHLPGYIWWGNQSEAADFGSESFRYRLSI